MTIELFFCTLFSKQNYFCNFFADFCKKVVDKSQIVYYTKHVR